MQHQRGRNKHQMNRQRGRQQDPPKPLPLPPLSFKQAPDIWHPNRQPIPLAMGLVDLRTRRRRKALHAVVTRAEHGRAQDVNNKVYASGPVLCNAAVPRIYGRKGEVIFAIP